MPSGKYFRTEKHRQEARNRLAERRKDGWVSSGTKGKKWDPIKDKDRIEAVRKRMIGNAYNKGRKFSSAIKLKMSLSKKGTGQKVGFRHSEETKRLFRLNRIGSKNSNWKGGLRSLNESIRRLRNYRDWKKAVLEKNGYLCSNCFDFSHNINVHHIVSVIDILTVFKITNTFEAINCPSLWDVDNGIILCPSCHKGVHKKYKYNKKTMNNSQPQEGYNIFSTRDIYLAATLITLKFFQCGLDFQIEGEKNRPIGFFKFESTPALMDAKAKYSQGLLAVEPKSFVTNLNSLKAEVIGVFSNPHLEPLKTKGK